ncbi:beta-ketoacyl-[acyl-carrier-protein] synthase family protein [Streptomyces monticola]|uniref:Beta-ketoacyl-[acyl-carrier-protein] synthase family protein n=1 Tax=Streptomyces monticola TaxID=2666263 RepID=A0ABW2JRR3_9ACTN
MNSPRIAVTGLGLLTSAGYGTKASWVGICSGRPTAAPDPELTGLPVDFSCRVPDLDADRRLGRRLSRRLDRFGAMAVLAAREAVEDAGFAAREDRPRDWDPARVAVVLGVGSNSLATYPTEFGRLNDQRADRVSAHALPRSIPNLVAGEVSLDLGATGPGFTVNTACASGSTAIGLARQLLLAGLADIAVCGGSDSVCTGMPAACFAQMRALSRRTGQPARASRPFDVDRDGFVLGEGAGVLVLERGEHAAARRARIHAHLDGFGGSCDAYDAVAPHPKGEGLAAAIKAALAEADLAPTDIDLISAHATGTQPGDLAEARALRSLFLDPPPVTALKGTLGHAIGAAGAIAAVSAVLSLEQGLVPPTANLDRQDPAIGLNVVSGVPRLLPLRTTLVNASGFGGQNAALAFSAA